ncbi:MAG: hypothetical protein ACLP50_01315 [Solirubrobacteraceae bacterium]
MPSNAAALGSLGIDAEWLPRQRAWSVGMRILESFGVNAHAIRHAVMVLVPAPLPPLPPIPPNPPAAEPRLTPVAREAITRRATGDELAG